MSKGHYILYDSPLFLSFTFSLLCSVSANVFFNSSLCPTPHTIVYRPRNKNAPPQSNRARRRRAGVRYRAGFARRTRWRGGATKREEVAYGERNGAKPSQWPRHHDAWPECNARERLLTAYKAKSCRGRDWQRTGQSRVSAPSRCLASALPFFSQP